MCLRSIHRNNNYRRPHPTRSCHPLVSALGAAGPVKHAVERRRFLHNVQTFTFIALPAAKGPTSMCYA
jgi:hypothetical protein